MIFRVPKSGAQFYMGGVKLNFSKKKFALLCAFSLFCFFAFSQDSQGGSAPSSQIHSSENSANQLPDESTLRIGGADGSTSIYVSENSPQNVGGSTVWVFFRMVFVLIVVVICIYFVMNFMKKKMGGAITEDDTFLRKVAAISIAPGKSVQIVTLLEHAYLLGVTDSSIDLLGEITDKELVDAMNLNADRNENNARARNFSDILSTFLNPKNAQSSGQKKTDAKISEFFEAQRKKLGSEE